MVKQGVNKLRIATAGSLLMLALVSVPANAHHNQNIVGPAIAFLTLGALLHHGHHSHYNHHYNHRRHHYKPRHRRSHSHGGYHNPRPKHYRHNYNY
ncbi:MAG: hypothetical protein GY896_06705 [Gammaproteobacteria bacterium]|nr:hypothetical protein [Gammaproteobacteria bacterium]